MPEPMTAPRREAPLDLAEIKRAMAALACRPGLSGAALRVGLRLLHHYDSMSGLCCPGHKRLMADTGLSRASVKRAVAELTRSEGPGPDGRPGPALFGLAAGFAIGKGQGRGMTSQYVPNRAAFFELTAPDRGGRKGAQNGSAREPLSAPEGAHPATGKGLSGEPRTNMYRITPSTEPEGGAPPAREPLPARPQRAAPPARRSARGAGQYELRAFGQFEGGGAGGQAGMRPKNPALAAAPLEAMELQHLVVAALRLYWPPEQRHEVLSALDEASLAWLRERLARLPAHGRTRLFHTRAHLQALRQSPLRVSA